MVDSCMQVMEEIAKRGREMRSCRVVGKELVTCTHNNYCGLLSFQLPQPEQSLIITGVSFYVLV